MQLTEHSEYQTVYLPNAAAFVQCQAAIAQWQASGVTIEVEPYDLTWTPITALAFVHELAALFQAYNQVLWQHFSYCRQCGGQCCVVAASDVRPFDLLAVALLGETAPHLPARITTTRQACIYLNGQQCSWPAGWRTIKCWSFYCLGSGPWPTDTPLSELYQAVTQELQQVVAEHLPGPLRRYQTHHQLVLADSLEDAVAFAQVVHTALDALFVAPLHSRYPLFERLPPPSQDAMPSLTGATGHNITLQGFDDPQDETGLGIIARISEEILQAETEGGEELLADLETLAWINESQPAQAQALIREMGQRYGQSPPPSEERLLAPWQQLRTYLQRMM